MHDNYLTFQQFNDPQLASAIADKLMENNISCIIEKDRLPIDPIFIRNIPEYDIRLQIPATEFTRAHAILEAYYQAHLEDVDPEYYLYSFNDAELIGIIRKPDEWGHFDYVLAKKLLNERGLPIPDEVAAEVRQQRLQELAAPETLSPADRIRARGLLGIRSKPLLILALIGLLIFLILLYFA